jgi:hypothetical protein
VFDLVPLTKKDPQIVVGLFNNYGGEDRARTCKRLLAVVFKTTALPIRLPLRIRKNLKIYLKERNISNLILRLTFGVKFQVLLQL